MQWFALIRYKRLLPVDFGNRAIQMIENAKADFAAQADPDSDYDGLLERYGEDSVTVRNFDGQPEITEMDAMIAYLQMLGTLVDFSTFEADASR